MGSETFENKLSRGQAGEAWVAAYIKSTIAGSVVDRDPLDGGVESPGGPRMRLDGGGLAIIPDLKVHRQSDCHADFFVEVKRKPFVWKLNSGFWQQGVDVGSFDDYRRVQEATGLRVELYFVAEAPTVPGGHAAPTGLYMATADELYAGIVETATASQYGGTGCYFWRRSVDPGGVLLKVCGLEEFHRVRVGAVT